MGDAPAALGSPHLPGYVPALHVGPNDAYPQRGETLLLPCFQSREGCQTAFPCLVSIHRSPAGETAKSRVGSGHQGICL